MLMLEVLKGARPKRRMRLASYCAGGLLVASLGAALPRINARQQTESALVDVLAAGKRDKATRTVIVGTHAYLTFSKDIQAVATGNEEILQVPQGGVDRRKVTLSGRKVGRTSLTVTYDDGSVEQFMLTVQRDLSVLESALRAIDPDIRAEMAPDRDAIVLTGEVTTAGQRLEAERAAASYLEASGTAERPQATQGTGTETARIVGRVINLLSVATTPERTEVRLERELARLGIRSPRVSRLQKGEQPNDEADVFVVEGQAPEIRSLEAVQDVLRRFLPAKTDENERYVNRLSLDGVSLSIEGVIERSIHQQIGATAVRVHRVNDAQFRGEADILVLTGSVPTQTKLTQALTLASRLFLQQQLIKDKLEGQFEEVTETFAGGLTRTTRRPLKLETATDDIGVAADESGALRGDDNSRLGRALGRARPEGGSSSSSGSSTFGYLLDNLIDSNIGRAKILELANGRILSFLTVDDLPQVRIDVRVYEINRTALLSWDTESGMAAGDYDIPGVNPNGFTNTDSDNVADIVEPGSGAPPLGTGETAVRSILGFLSGGLTSQTQLGGEHFVIDTALSVLETEGIARSLATPSLTVLSGELATFGVGGQIPFTENLFSETGVSTTSVQFIDFGVNLAIRPLVDDRDFITLDIVPEISNPDAQLTAQVRVSSGTNPPTTAFSTRILRTSSRLRDGQALLIGGLTERNRTDSSSQTPWLHKVPILGYLFKDFDYSDGDRELVIVVTPAIIRDAPDGALLWAFPESGELRGAPAPGAEPQASAAPANSDPTTSESATKEVK